MRILGIDPGLKGGFALLDDSGLSIGRLPVKGLRRNSKDRYQIDAEAFYQLLVSNRPDLCVLENVGGIKGQSASGSFNFGDSFGALRACWAIYALNYNSKEIKTISPVVWRAKMRVRRECLENKVDQKEGSRRVASRLFPQAAWPKSKRGIVDDGPAEAALIATYWRDFRLLPFSSETEQPTEPAGGNPADWPW